MDLGWARRPNHLWWPVYICQTKMFRKEDLHYLQNEHKSAMEVAVKSKSVLVYYLGQYTFASRTKGDVKQWACPEHNTFSGHETITDAEMLLQFTTAMTEAKVYVDTGILPFLAPSDVNQALKPPAWPQDIAPGTITWLKHATKSWTPAYVLDPTHLSAKRGVASSHVKDQLRLAKKNPHKYYLVYKFGECNIMLWKRENAKMLLWGGPEHSKLLLGIPRRESNTFLATAMQRLESFLAAKQNQKKLAVNNAYTVKVSWLRLPSSQIDPNQIQDNDDDDVSTEDEAENDTMASSEAPPAMIIYSKKTHLATVMGTSKRPAISPQPKTSLPPPVPPLFRNGVAWAHVRGQLWWPVYICNPHLWSPQPDSPTLTYDVYSFGYHTMRSRAFTLAQLRPWKCPEAPRLRETIFTALDQSKVSDQETLGNALVEADNYYVEYEQIQSYSNLDINIKRINRNNKRGVF
ncbi:hypothetical protein, variant 1 [Aphanomyces astaci]|uniref:PWWP domain-containing protein n=1 Tax=Aphanomyces astaci TaxID=112090 RepID=W4H5A1_APHAT|nr:hypothetical protein, variant 1 [Aphanomyces astaci]ETV86781.1 hypothetical protein, variant 1 [Aphanomyces astaci]|eukprot:XP_009823582.1 hypothetical protein, variant 1 [Aphanomyces astaci]